MRRTANKQSNAATSNHNLILQVKKDLSIFDFKVSTHTHYDDACRKFALAYNMEDVAKQSGMRAQTLRNKLNPDQPHQLTVLEVLALNCSRGQGKGVNKPGDISSYSFCCWDDSAEHVF